MVELGEDVVAELVTVSKRMVGRKGAGGSRRNLSRASRHAKLAVTRRRLAVASVAS